MADSFEEELVQNSRLYYEAFLPGAVTRLRNQALARVSGVSNNSDALDGIDKSQLLDVARKFMTEWKAAGGEYDAMLEEAVSRGDLQIQSPSAVYVTPFPLVLVCEYCGALENHDKPRRQHDNALEGVYRRLTAGNRLGRNTIVCQRAGCKGRMRQIPYVMVHRCGHIAPVATPRSARGFADLGFRDGGGQFRASSFFDLTTGQNVSNASADLCPACADKVKGHGLAVQRGTSVTGGDSFFPQVMQFVALSEKAGDVVSKVNAELTSCGEKLTGPAKDIVEGLVSSLLRMVDSAAWQSETSHLLGGSPVSPDDVAATASKRLKLIAEIEDLLKLIAQGYDLKETLSFSQANLSKLDVKLGKSGDKFASVRDLISSDFLLLQLARQRRTMEAVLLRHDVQRQSAGGAAEGSCGMLSDWPFVRDCFGIEDAAHIPDLKVVVSGLGFTREKREPERDEDAVPLKLNPFEDQVHTTSRGKAMLYALSAQTEALWIRLDPIKVLRWCVQSVGWEEPPTEVYESAAKAHAYLLRKSPALSGAQPESDESSSTSEAARAAPLNLMHSICHALLLSARRHSGYDAQSLTEYLFPMDLSFIVYVTSVQNYTAGGLLMLFQHYLKRWFEDASMFAFNCAFDPICSDVGSACAGCIYTSRGCETFNAGVSRAYLHGGQADQHHHLWVDGGYWDGAALKA
ncbi:hypothetical protein R69608_07036 [Paraburkholderia nemoris]|uniref:hypothetical protein n=1 Tax=Paraburkholderia nemoris TaxID=2793076 RepID=UPI00191373E5|nr:hypothetical protein [Paraburkholderia nemoris]MBK5152453.1 hypothetical protein [Burkholderia sp. R-69608]CAE6967701.1 hypothetical protein R69608_07036 [Paraburkholderia nemoris]